VTSLLKPNLHAHDYEPSPADVEAIAPADGSSPPRVVCALSLLVLRAPFQ
jgi:hypothetical protein